MKKQSYMDAALGGRHKAHLLLLHRFTVEIEVLRSEVSYLR